MSTQEKQVQWRIVSLNVAGLYVAQPGDVVECDTSLLPPFPGISVQMPVGDGSSATVKKVAGINPVSLTNLTPVDATFSILGTAGQSVTTTGDGTNPYVVAVVAPGGGPPPLG